MEEGACAHCASVICLLKLVDLPVADVVVEVSDGSGRVASLADIAPALVVVLRAVKRKRRREDHMHRLSHRAGEQLDVDVQRHGRLLVGRLALDAGNSVVLGLIIVIDHEGILEEGRITALSGHGEVW